ncbi:hypothetical protein GOBAR_DD31088 [Gossypium barbadense]|nr:hypothetical protein GOBAR_DD31088 [Gossypium barbadense]
MGGLRMKNEGGGIEKTGTSSETLRIGLNVGFGKSKFGTNGDGKNIDGLVGMVPIRQTIQGMVDRLEVKGRAANTGFNDLLDEDEKKGGSNRVFASCPCFQQTKIELSSHGKSLTKTIDTWI